MFFLQTCSKTFQQKFLYTLFLFHHLVFADPPYPLCSENANFTDNNSPFQNNLNNFYKSLSSKASISNFYNTSIGHGPDTVYGLFLCLKYVSQDGCENCINSASEDMQRLCSNTNEAVLWQDLCLLRYSKQKFFGQLDVTGNVPLYNNQTVTEPERFKTIVNQTLHNISRLAAFNRSYGMYATTDVPFSDTKTIYALVQCTIDLSPDDCNTCLEIAIINISSFSSYRGARLISRSCYLRYEFYAFDKEANGSFYSTSNQGGHKGKLLLVVLGIGSANLVGMIILGLCVYRLSRRNQTNTENKKSGQEVQINNAGGPNDMDYLNHNLQGTYDLNPQELPFIDMETINEATDNFSESNKLGQGGFGPVYKGVMPNGEEVAVKRLSICSEQGSDEFVNEVVLILKLQHKNLVRLLGFCIHQEEKLLIYEFMPNTSLDVFLIDCRKRAQLNWRKRLNIITGIARGVLYLHQDSRLRIIHRDLKPSNVLLDKDMNPKISDFGMARIFGGTDGEANTAKIVGTYGYMAPEFAMEGLYSVKSDVFSFGVLLLELITGRRNSGFHLSKLAPSLIAYVSLYHGYREDLIAVCFAYQAWKMWNDGKGVELIDPLLSDSYCVDEYLRCMHIGLLCVQEDAYDRPTMSSVVVMLNSETTSLSQPERPANSIGKFTDHQETCYNNLSINNLTMSEILPR